MFNHIISFMNKNDGLYVFLDLKKAFDMVDHHILLKKLYAYGIRGKVICFIDPNMSFMTICNLKHIMLNVACPRDLLWVLYTILYADDTCVLLNGKYLNNLIKSINTELDLLSTWLKSNKLSLNTHKAFFHLFHRARMKTNNSVNIIVDKCVLNKVTSIKYLGVIIGHKLSWIEHISYVKKNIQKALEYCIRPDNF